MVRKRGEGAWKGWVTIVACIFNDVATGVTVVDDDADDDGVKEKHRAKRPAASAALCRLRSDE